METRKSEPDEGKQRKGLEEHRDHSPTTAAQTRASNLAGLANDQNHRVAASDVEFRFGPDGNSGALYCYAPVIQAALISGSYLKGS